MAASSKIARGEEAVTRASSTLPAALIANSSSSQAAGIVHSMSQELIAESFPAHHKVAAGMAFADRQEAPAAL